MKKLFSGLVLAGLVITLASPAYAMAGKRTCSRHVTAAIPYYTIQVNPGAPCPQDCFGSGPGQGGVWYTWVRNGVNCTATPNNTKVGSVDGTTIA